MCCSEKKNKEGESERKRENRAGKMRKRECVREKEVEREGPDKEGERERKRENRVGKMRKRECV